MERGDVHAIGAEDGAECADEARLVGVGDVKHARTEIGFKFDALDLDDARLAVGEDRACHRALVDARLHRDADVGAIGTALRLPHLVHLDAAFLGGNRRRHHVDGAELRLQHACECCRGECARVHLAHVARKLDHHICDGGIGELAHEAAELVRQFHIGAEARRFVGGNGRHVEGIGDGPGDQEIGHLLGHLKGHVLLRFVGGGTEMRRGHHILHAKERMRGGGLDLEHVKGRTCHMLALDRLEQRILVHQSAAGAVDDAHTLLALGQRLGIDDVAGLVGERRVQRDEVGAAEDVVQLDLLHAEIERALGRQEGIEGDDLHLEADGAVGHDRADVAAADHAQRLVVEFHTHEAVLLPLAGMGGGVRFRNLAGERHHHRDRVFRRCDGVAEGRVHDHDAALAGSGNIDVVDADAGTADHLQLGGGGDDLRRHLGGGADGEAVILRDGLKKGILVLAEVGQIIDVDAAILEDLHGGFGELVGNEYARCGHGSVPVIV